MHALMAFLLLALCDSVVSEDATNGGTEMTHEQLEQLLTAASQESFAKLDEVVEDIRNKLENDIAEQLGNIENVVEGVSHRQKMKYYCEGYTECGQHGECYVSEGTEGPACKCTKLWQGTHCDEYRVCDAKVEAYKLSSANIKALLGSSVPRCDSDGFYSAVQYQGSMVGCVTKFGSKLEYAIPIADAPDTMPCDCARDEYQAGMSRAQLLPAMLHFRPSTFTCTKDGSYPTPAEPAE